MENNKMWGCINDGREEINEMKWRREIIKWFSGEQEWLTGK